MDYILEILGMDDNDISRLIIIKSMMIIGLATLLISLRKWIMRPGRTKTKAEYDEINSI